jgi:hypothetical protein
MPTVFGNHFIFLDLRFFVLCSYIFFFDIRGVASDHSLTQATLLFPFFLVHLDALHNC